MSIYQPPLSFKGRTLVPTYFGVPEDFWIEYQTSIEFGYREYIFYVPWYHGMALEEIKTFLNVYGTITGYTVVDNIAKIIVHGDE